MGAATPEPHVSSASPDSNRASLQSRGADPSIRTEDYDPYLNPGRKLPVEVSRRALSLAGLALHLRLQRRRRLWHRRPAASLPDPSPLCPNAHPTPQVALEDDGGAIRAQLLALEKKYAKTPKRRVPHADIGCW